MERRMIEGIRTLIFDWDGTLHESMHIYKKAFLKAFQFLVDHGYAEYRRWTEDEIRMFLGMNPKEMWASFTPKQTDEIIQVASSIISDSMSESIKNGEAKLYAGAWDVLMAMKAKGYRLVYLSNSKTYYMQRMDEAFGLKHVFDLMIASEMYQYVPKHDILHHIKDIFPKPWAVIGDRHVDMEAAKHHGAFAIACDYGYGKKEELKDGDLHIYTISELLEIL